MNRPWLQFHTRDWLDNKELRRCSPTARAILADLMCLAHEGTPYGYLTDKIGPLTDDYMASRCHVRIAAFRRASAELKTAERVKDDDGRLFIPRMVKDEEIRLKRAAGGVFGGNPKLTQKVNLPPNHTHTSKGYPPSDSDSVSVSDSDDGSLFPEEPKNGHGTVTRRPWLKPSFERFWAVCWNRVGKDAARNSFERKAKTQEQANRIIAAAVAQGPELVRHAQEHNHGVLHPSTWLNQGRYEDEGVTIEALESEEKPLWDEPIC